MKKFKTCLDTYFLTTNNDLCDPFAPIKLNA